MEYANSVYCLYRMPVTAPCKTNAQLGLHDKGRGNRGTQPCLRRRNMYTEEREGKSEWERGSGGEGEDRESE